MNFPFRVAAHEATGAEASPEAEQTKTQSRSWGIPMMTCAQPHPRPADSSRVRAKYGMHLSVLAPLLRETGGDVLPVPSALEIKT
jgi:hypothetical protein